MNYKLHLVSEGVEMLRIRQEKIDTSVNIGCLEQRIKNLKR